MLSTENKEVCEICEHCGLPKRVTSTSNTQEIENMQMASNQAQGGQMEAGNMQTQASNQLCESKELQQGYTACQIPQGYEEVFFIGQRKPMYYIVEEEIIPFPQGEVAEDCKEDVDVKAEFREDVQDARAGFREDAKEDFKKSYSKNVSKDVSKDVNKDFKTSVSKGVSEYVKKEVKEVKEVKDFKQLCNTQGGNHKFYDSINLIDREHGPEHVPEGLTYEYLPSNLSIRERRSVVRGYSSEDRNSIKKSTLKSTSLGKSINECKSQVGEPIQNKGYTTTTTTTNIKTYQPQQERQIYRATKKTTYRATKTTTQNYDSNGCQPCQAQQVFQEIKKRSITPEVKVVKTTSKTTKVAGAREEIIETTNIHSSKEPIDFSKFNYRYYESSSFKPKTNKKVIAVEQQPVVVQQQVREVREEVRRGSNYRFYDCNTGYTTEKRNERIVSKNYVD